LHVRFKNIGKRVKQNSMSPDMWMHADAANLKRQLIATAVAIHAVGAVGGKGNTGNAPAATASLVCRENKGKATIKRQEQRWICFVPLYKDLKSYTWFLRQMKKNWSCHAIGQAWRRFEIVMAARFYPSTSRRTCQCWQMVDKACCTNHRRLRVGCLDLKPLSLRPALSIPAQT